MKLKRKDSVPAAVERVVRKRIASALQIIYGKPEALIEDAAVHKARNQLKRSRGVLRLVREDLGRKRFARANRRLRDASRPLSDLRDATVLIDTWDDLCNKESIHSGSLEHIRVALEGRRRRVRKRVMKDRGMRKVMVKRLRRASGSIARWSHTHHGWNTIAAGLRRTYRRGRAAMEAAVQDSSDAAFHESRKRAKDLLYAAEFIVNVRPESIQPIIDDAHAFTDLLGDDHDFAVLQDVIDKELELRLSAAQRSRIKRLVSRRRRNMQQHACELGRRLYAPTEATFVTRIHEYWKAWRHTR